MFIIGLQEIIVIGISLFVGLWISFLYFSIKTKNKNKLIDEHLKNLYLHRLELKTKIENKREFLRAKLFQTKNMNEYRLLKEFDELSDFNEQELKKIMGLMSYEAKR